MHRRAGRKRIVAALRGRLAAASSTLLFGVAMVAALSPALAPASAVADEPVLTATVGSGGVGQPMPAGFLGVSFEYKAMHLYTGRDPRSVNPVLVALLRGMTPGQQGVIRIGGDSSDQTWWPIRGMIPPGGITYALTKGWLRTTKALASAAGAKLILGVNLAAGRPAIAAAEARALLAGLGSRSIDAFEIGNEPDLYNLFPWYRNRRGHVVLSRSPSYNIAALTNEFSRWRAAMPVAPLAGPTLASLNWMPGLDHFIASQPRLSVVTFHRYPLRGCLTDPTSPFFASIPNLLNDPSSAGLAQQVAPYTQVAHAHGLPFRLDELNSAACSGKRGVSDTFASALWAIDTLFNLAAAGVDGVNFHSLPGAAYEPFTFTQSGSAWHAFVHPLYYGAMVFAQAFPPGARLLPVTAPAGPVKVWATQATDGRIRVAMINKSPDTGVQIQLQLPGTADPASLQALQAPGIAAKAGVSFAGQSFGPRTDTGRLPGALGSTPIQAAADVYTVEVPAASAMLLTR